MDLTTVIALTALIMALGCWNIYRSSKRKQFEEQAEKVLDREGYDRFRDMLDSEWGRRMLPAYAAGQKKLEAAISCKKHDEARRLIGQLNQTPMPAKQFVNYNMMVLGYAVDQKDAQMGQTACDALHRRGISKSYATEAQQVYDIYLLHKANHIEEVKTFASKVKNPASKATAYYRLARQYHYLNDEEACRKYLLMARNVYQEKTWQGIIQKILDGDNSQLDK